MEMKWHPIIDGDLNGIPRDEELLFTVFDEEDGETYSKACWTEEGFEGNTIVRSGEDMNYRRTIYGILAGYRKVEMMLDEQEEAYRNQGLEYIRSLREE